MIGPMQALLILVVVLVIFGADKLSGVGKAMGKSVREFKDEVQTDDTKTNKSEDNTKDPDESA